MSPPTKTKKKPTTDTPPESPAGVLRLADVAKMWGVQPGTVSQYLKESKPLVGDRKGRYADRPVPKPRYMGAAKKTPWWPESQRAELMDWFTGRLGLAHGTGGRRAGSKAAS